MNDCWRCGGWIEPGTACAVIHHHKPIRFGGVSDEGTALFCAPCYAALPPGTTRPLTAEQKWG